MRSKWSAPELQRSVPLLMSRLARVPGSMKLRLRERRRSRAQKGKKMEKPRDESLSIHESPGNAKATPRVTV
jgi:hypothetical protein